VCVPACTGQLRVCYIGVINIFSSLFTI